jgi:DNA polymerase I
MNSNKLMLIDGNSILNRAFYGLQGSNLLATSEGLYTNAVFGFINIMHKYLEEEKPDFLCVAFDLKGPTFRHKEFDGYKANRKGMPPELAMQMPIIKEVLDAMNVKRLEYEGFEADDIIGSVSLCAEKSNFEVVIVTGDKDSFQLISKTTKVKMPVTKAGKTETEDYTIEKMLERYGVTPIEFIDVKGLMGDPSDNIPGVPGIGEKTALELIKKFSTIENIFQDIGQIDKKGVREKLEANKELAFLSKRLATINRDMPEMCKIDDLRRIEFNTDKVFELFKKLEFKSLIDKFKLTQSKPELKRESKKIECIEDLNGLNKYHEKVLKAGELSIYYLIDKLDNFENKLIGLALSCEIDESIFISFNNCIDEDTFLNIFKDVFEAQDIKKYGHEMKNFTVYLMNKGFNLNGLSFDTMIAAYILEPSRNTYTVSELGSEYLKLDMDSIEALSGKGKNFVSYKEMTKESLSAVSGTYAEVIFKLKEELTNILKENEQISLFDDIELPLVEVLAHMEHWGFKVDIESLKKFSVELEGKITLLTGEIYGLAEEEFNINSTKQLGVILFDKLNLPALKKTKTGYSTDAEVLEQLAEKHDIVKKILEYRQLVKLKSTYVEGLLLVINPNTGKIHSSFNQTVTVTGRISSTEPNLQNIPIKLEMGRKIRKVFVPSDENYILSDADYSQIELRVLAHITQDENMIYAFKNEEDIHTTTASQVFGVEKSEVTQLLRSRAKAVNFGIVYGIGDFSLSKDLGITRKEARIYIDGYLDKYPNVREYMHNTVEEGKSKGFVTTLFNRRRYLPELGSSNFNLRSFGERIAMNTPIQGSAADIIKIAMVKVFKSLKDRGLKSRLILQVHDELLIETHLTEKAEVEGILKKCMEEAAKLSVPLSVEVKTGQNWYETK